MSALYKPLFWIPAKAGIQEQLTLIIELLHQADILFFSEAGEDRGTMNNLPHIKPIDVGDLE